MLRWPGERKVARLRSGDRSGAGEDVNPSPQCHPEPSRGILVFFGAWEGPRPRSWVLKSKFQLLMLRSLEHAGPALEKIVVGGLRRVQGGQGPIVAWPLVCGTAVAQRTRALDFADGVLQIEVPDTGWRNELRTLASKYLAVMNRYVSDPVKRIEFVVAGSVQRPVPTRDRT